MPRRRRTLQSEARYPAPITEAILTPWPNTLTWPATRTSSVPALVVVQLASLQAKAMICSATTLMLRDCLMLKVVYPLHLVVGEPTRSLGSRTNNLPSLTGTLPTWRVSDRLRMKAATRRMNPRHDICLAPAPCATQPQTSRHVVQQSDTSQPCAWLGLHTAWALIFGTAA
jgi:hypothetical protein